MVKVDEPLAEWARRPANRSGAIKVEAYEEYLQRIPALKTRRIPMAIDEWAYTGGGNNLKGGPRQRDGAAGDFATLGSDQDGRPHDGDCLDRLQRYGIGAQYDRAFSSSSIETTLVPCRWRSGGNSPPPPPLYPVWGPISREVNAGSQTYPVDVVAALTSDGKSLTVAVINPNESSQQLDLSFTGDQTRRQGAPVADDGG